MQKVPNVVMSYRRSGSTLTHEEIFWFGNTPIARFTTSGTSLQLVHLIHSDHLNSPRALTNARIQGARVNARTFRRWDLLVNL
jgi:hypothetical protein